MKKIINNPPPEVTEEKIEVNRAQIEHRATWMALIFDELKKRGLDAEGITRAAISRCGGIHGSNMRAKCSDPEDARSFHDVFMADTSVKTFCMDNAKADKESFSVQFHYCPLISAWQKLGFDDERCALLCDIAMDGDRGIAKAMGMEMKLDGTIANGDETCSLRFILR
jgi:hypothetical protein